MENGIKISANIIVKDEEQNIESALKSVKEIADEIIVIDTGSNDKTPQICSRYGAQLFFHNWENDFSSARNIAIKYSAFDWIVSIDADEVLNFTRDNLPVEDMKDESIGGINLVIKNFLGDGETSPVSKHRYTRIFRNANGIKYSGRIHEQIRESIEQNEYSIIDTELEILHFGYKTNDNEKLKRNKELLKIDLEEDPDDDWKVYHLAETEFSSGNKDSSKELFLKVKSSPQLTELQREKVLTRLGQIYLGEDNFNDAEEILDFKSADDDTEGLRKYVLAAVYLSSGKPKEALGMYEDSKTQKSGLVDKQQLKAATEGAKKYLKLTGN